MNGDSPQQCCGFISVLYKLLSPGICRGFQDVLVPPANHTPDLSCHNNFTTINMFYSYNHKTAQHLQLDRLTIELLRVVK